MLSAKTTNPAVIQLHNGQPHVRTEIVILSPIGTNDEFTEQLRSSIDLVQKIVTAINENVEAAITDQINSDIESISSQIRNL